MLLPFPGCSDWGKRILFMGLNATGGCISSQAEKNRQDEKNKNKLTNKNNKWREISLL